MSARTTRWAGPVSVPHGVDTALFTVPVGKVALVKLISYVNSGTTNAANVVVGIGSSAGQHRIDRQIVQPLTAIQVPTNQVLRAGETLWCRIGTPVSGAANCTLTVSGASLDA